MGNRREENGLHSLLNDGFLSVSDGGVVLDDHHHFIFTPDVKDVEV